MNKERKNQSIYLILLAVLAVLLSSLACSTVRNLWGRPSTIEDEGNIYSGTYKGKITDTELATGGLLGEWEVQGTVDLNEIIITVADDGSVAGSFSYYKIGNILLSDDGSGAHAECVVSSDHYYNGEATGQLIEGKGTIIFEIEQTIIGNNSEGCSVQLTDQPTTKTPIQHFEIEIIDDEMFGTSIASVEGGHPVKATFRLTKN